MKNLSAFDPRIESRISIFSDDVSELIRNIEKLESMKNLFYSNQLDHLVLLVKKTINMPLLKIQNIRYCIKTKINLKMN